MKTFPLCVLALLLCVGCPKEKSSTTAPDPALTVTSFAIFIADAEGVSPPDGVRVAASAAGGSLLLVEAPAVLVDQPPEGWRRWARIGDAAAMDKLGNPGFLLSAGAAGMESSPVYLSLSAEGAADPEIRVKLQGSGAAVNAIAGDVVTANVPRGAWGALLKLPYVVSVESAGTVGTKGG
jgi:hypothetical protein